MSVAEMVSKQKDDTVKSVSTNHLVGKISVGQMFFDQKTLNCEELHLKMF